MTQEFVTLPREVVERAIEALFCTDSEEGSTAYKNELEAVKKLRAALDQPQANQPAMTPIAQRKLEDLVASGYTISGYSIYHEQKHQHGFVTGAGLVGWWKPDGVEYPQPQGEQEPFTVLVRKRSWLANQWEAAPRGFPDYGRSWADERVNVYTHPQPKLEPLTDAEIGQAVRWFYQDHRAAEMGLEDDIAVARAIEAAHNIK